MLPIRAKGAEALLSVSMVKYALYAKSAEAALFVNIGENAIHGRVRRLFYL